MPGNLRNLDDRPPDHSYVARDDGAAKWANALRFSNDSARATRHAHSRRMAEPNPISSESSTRTRDRFCVRSATTATECASAGSAVGVGAVPCLMEHPFAPVEHLDRGRPLMRIHPDPNTAHLPAPHRGAVSPDRQGGHRYFELGKSLLSHSLASGARQERTPDVSHPRGGQPMRERPAGHLGQGPVGP